MQLLKEMFKATKIFILELNDFHSVKLQTDLLVNIYNYFMSKKVCNTHFNFIYI